MSRVGKLLLRKHYSFIKGIGKYCVTVLLRYLSHYENLLIMTISVVGGISRVNFLTSSIHSVT